MQGIQYDKGLNMAKHKGLSFYEKEKKISKGMVREIFSVVFFCFAAMLLAFVIVISFGLKTSVIGVSMEPALSNGQTVFIDRFVYKLLSPKRGDVIVFLPNGNTNSHDYLKRVVALPGEKYRLSADMSMWMA